MRLSHKCVFLNYTAAIAKDHVRYMVQFMIFYNFSLFLEKKLSSRKVMLLISTQL